MFPSESRIHLCGRRGNIKGETSGCPFKERGLSNDSHTGIITGVERKTERRSNLVPPTRTTDYTECFRITIVTETQRKKTRTTDYTECFRITIVTETQRKKPEPQITQKRDVGVVNSNSNDG